MVVFVIRCAFKKISYTILATRKVYILSVFDVSSVKDVLGDILRAIVSSVMHVQFELHDISGRQARKSLVLVLQEWSLTDKVYIS